MNIYLGNVDALAQTETDLSVIVIDGKKLASSLVPISHVIQWQAGVVQLQLINGQDTPNQDGVYLCTDLHGNVRYGLVTATAANCYRFQEHYANGGSTMWFDKASASAGVLSEDELDMNELFNWMLLLPTTSVNRSDATKFPEHYKPVTSATPCSVVPNPCDNRTQEQKNHAETDSEEDREQAEGESHYQKYRWMQNLRGTRKHVFEQSVASFLDVKAEPYFLDKVSLVDWMRYAKYLHDNNIGPESITPGQLHRCRNIFVVARSCYFRLIGSKPASHKYFDRELEKLRNGRTC